MSTVDTLRDVLAHCQTHPLFQHGSWDEARAALENAIAQLCRLEQYREALATAVGLLGECRPSASYPGYILGPDDWFARRDALLAEVGKEVAQHE